MVRGEGSSPVGGEGVPEGLLSSPTTRGRGRNYGEAIATRMRDLPAQLEDVNGKFVGFVREQPLVALGAACAVGYVMGRILRRVM